MESIIILKQCPILENCMIVEFDPGGFFMRTSPIIAIESSCYRLFEKTLFCDERRTVRDLVWWANCVCVVACLPARVPVFF